MATAALVAMYLYFDRHARAILLLPVVEEPMPRVGPHLPILHAWNAIGSAWPLWEGRFDDTLAFVDRALDAAAKGDDALLLFRTAEAMARGGKGEYERTRKLLYELLADSERIGNVTHQGRVPNMIG